jgi:PqqA peptide cyclase
VKKSLCPKLAPRTRLQQDPVTNQWVLLYPEGLLELNPSGVAILQLCDGTFRLSEILEQLSARFQTKSHLIEADVMECLNRLEKSTLVEWLVSPIPAVVKAASDGKASINSDKRGSLYRPLGLLAELTYRCPLHCPYCSNPTGDKGKAKGNELSVAEWKRVLEAARQLGVLHALFSGGEPLQYQGLEELVGKAHELELYTNLITSGLGFSSAKARALKKAGLDSVQLSFQSDEGALGDQIAGTKVHDLKLKTAELARSLEFPLTVNIVLHRANIDRVKSLIELAEKLGAHRLELANTQYYGWAFKNRNLLLPTREQVFEAKKIAQEAMKRLKGRMEILYVVPDYFSERPKPCMNGWGQRYLTVNPWGDVLPCPTSGEIKSLRFENVREKPLGWIWRESESFNLFRGTQWMPEPCQSCEFKEEDFGGCRCQAALLTGDATVTDPACKFSPFRGRMEEAVAASKVPSIGDWLYRTNP